MTPQGRVAGCRGPRYLEIDSDVGSSSTAHHVTGMVQGALKSVIVDIGVLLEGRATVGLTPLLCAYAEVHFLSSWLPVCCNETSSAWLERPWAQQQPAPSCRSFCTCYLAATSLPSAECSWRLLVWARVIVWQHGPQAGFFMTQCLEKVAAEELHIELRICMASFAWTTARALHI